MASHWLPRGKACRRDALSQLGHLTRRNYFIRLQVIKGENSVDITGSPSSGSIPVPHLSASGALQQEGGRHRGSWVEDLLWHVSYREKASR